MHTSPADTPRPSSGPHLAPSTALSSELIDATARFTRFLRSAVGGTDSGATWRALALLAAHGPLRITELAALDQLTQPSATSLVTRLVREGLVAREADPTDGRAVRVSLTGAGADRLAAHRRDAGELLVPRIEALSGADRAALARAAELLREFAATTVPDPEETR